MAEPSDAIAATVLAMTRSTAWELVGEVALAFDAHHPQGMVRIDGSWWISTVDLDARRGSVLVVDGEGRLVDEVPVGDDRCYHPGGIDFDGTALWVAAAEYRPDSTAVIQRLQPGRSPELAFTVDDHVGAVARCGPEGDLVGWSWGSRRFFRWQVDGTLVAERINPGLFVDHQDCQWLGSGLMLCGGVAAVSLAQGMGWLGGIGLLDVDALSMARDVPFPMYSPSGRVATHNPIWAEVSGGRLVVHALADDGHGVIRSYATPLLAPPG
jgi:hypothetical protein